MWYDEQLQTNGYLNWSKADLAEFGNLYEGKEFVLHGRTWEIIECSGFSNSCKIKPKEKL